VTRDAYIVLVAMTDLRGMAGPLTLHARPGGPRLDVVGIAPIYLDRETAQRDWPGVLIIPITITIPDPEEPS